MDAGPCRRGLAAASVFTLRWRLALDTVDTPSQHWPDPVVAGAFIAENWTEHLRQHERVTLADRALEEELGAFQVGGKAPVVTHLVGARTRF